MLTLRRYRGLFRNRNFALLWGGQAISRTGSGFSGLVINWTVYDLTGSPLMLGLVLLLQSISPALIGFVGGIIADRFSRKRILIASDAVSALTVALLAGVTAAGRLNAWHLMIAALVLSATTTTFRIARQAALPGVLTPEDDLLTANALLGATFKVARLVSPIVAGLLLGPLGTTNLFLIDLATYGVSLLTLVQIHILQRRTPSSSLRAHPLRETVEAWRFIRQDRALLLVVGTFGLGTMLSGGAPRVGFPLLAERIGAGPAAYGLFDSLVGVGILVGTVLVGMVTLRDKVRAVFWAWIVQGILLGLLAFNDQLLWLSLVVFATGLAQPPIDVSTETLIQERTSDEIRGRVFGLWTVGIWLGESIGYVALGALFLQTSLAVGFVVAGLALTLANVFLLYWVRLKPLAPEVSTVAPRVSIQETGDQGVP